jgi:type II restriction enzyme
MPTSRQDLGRRGEQLVAQRCPCPKCKRARTLRRLPANFKCADVICDFCGYLAQVKTASSRDPSCLPRSLLGAAWRVQKERMDAGFYFPLFVVLFASSRRYAVYYLSADHQSPRLFSPRAPLSPKAHRAGWQGFNYNLKSASPGAIVKIFEVGAPSNPRTGVEPTPGIQPAVRGGRSSARDPRRTRRGRATDVRARWRRRRRRAKRRG